MALGRSTCRWLEALGLTATTAKKLRALAEVYFGQTAFSGQRCTARDNAHTQRHNLTTLLVIEGFARQTVSGLKPA